MAIEFRVVRFSNRTHVVRSFDFDQIALHSVQFQNSTLFSLSGKRVRWRAKKCDSLINHTAESQSDCKDHK